MSLSKKIFITSSSIFVVVLVFFGIYNLSFKKYSDTGSSADNKSSNNSDQEKTNPPVKEERIQQITDEATIAPILSNDENSIKYYSKSTGKVYSVDLIDFSKKALSETNLAGIIDVSWSPDKSKVLSKFSGGTNFPKFSFFDYSTKSGNKLNENIGAATWQNNNKILYTYFDKKTKEKSINIADPDGKNWHKITVFSPNSIVVAPVPKSGFVSFWNKPDSFSQTIMQSTPIIGGETKTLSANVFGADYLWNSDGTMFLRSNVNQKGGHVMELGFANNSGGEYKNLGVPTFVSKCVWSKNNDFVFYALPGSISEKSIMPNDYISNVIATSDTFWKVNLKTGEKTRLAALTELTASYDATDLFLNSNESYLFFTNRTDGKLYRIKL